LTGLLSGYFKEGLGDASILPMLQDHCVLIKDFTTILNLSDQVRDNVFGELRDMYDGKIVAAYRNFQFREFGTKGKPPVRFNMIACVTDRIRSFNQTDLGERFMQMEYDSYWDERGNLERNSVDRSQLGKIAIANVLNRISSRDRGRNPQGEHMGLAWGFLDHLVDRINTDDNWVQARTHALAEDTDFQTYIQNISDWVAYARSRVPRDREKQIQYRAQPEYGSRLQEQLTKMTIAISLVLDTYHDDPRVKSIIRKYALDTGYGFQEEIMFAIAHSETNKLGIPAIAMKLGLGQTHVINCLSNMQELGMVKYHTPAVRRPGHQPYIYQLSPELGRIATNLGFMVPPKEEGEEE
jgi:hypothetical protein